MNPQPAQLLEAIRKLEARVAALEAALSVSANSVTLKVGTSSIKVDKTSITIKSDTVTLSGTSRIDIKSSGNVKIKGSRILQN